MVLAFGDVLDPDYFARLAALQRRVEAIDGVDGATSVVDLIEVLHRELSGSSDLPRSRELLAQYLLLFEVAGGEAS